ncbi:tRNA (cytosine(32)/uridine(32)-2'-O)-methyltransferase TrmJ [unidentified bacterial endosymbiont]|uniref:tRNA (cytosine(32)/uridine(32)-2'-O)-methyltransferase TrmJ n=1 Tax=unidentified bacterial endosymbiont TaxID=2355 RepID=UPI0020A0A7C5|nr:tRNA (cytosine(32)/uridine(32)-2'-O)-methyltransferase TrmJ [unidentified bacterial endosymbiont]
MLQSIRIVLVEPSHPGNIGATARAMKTMGLASLLLVNPQVRPDAQSIALAAGASDVLDTLTIVDSLAEAIGDCGLVVGLSNRLRTLAWPALTPRQGAEVVLQEVRQYPVALLFGCERNGLSNAALQQCHYQITIPANPDYSSLNVAMAVQIITYELYSAYGEQPTPAVDDLTEYPSVAALDDFYRHLARVLEKIGFIRPQGSGQVLPQCRRLFTRARLEEGELRLWRGILTAIEKRSRST